MPDIATAALIRKRAVMAGDTESPCAELGQLRADLAHLDAAIHIMCPDAEPELIRPQEAQPQGLRLVWATGAASARPWRRLGQPTGPCLR